MWDFNESLSIPKIKNITISSVENEIKLREKMWGTRRGIISSIQRNIVYIETPYTSCLNWYMSIIKKYKNLSFILRYNDEYMEEFYGWAVSLNGNLIANDEIILD